MASQARRELDTPDRTDRGRVHVVRRAAPPPHRLMELRERSPDFSPFETAVSRGESKGGSLKNHPSPSQRYRRLALPNLRFILRRPGVGGSASADGASANPPPLADASAGGGMWRGASKLSSRPSMDSASASISGPPALTNSDGVFGHRPSSSPTSKRLCFIPTG